MKTKSDTPTPRTNESLCTVAQRTGYFLDEMIRANFARKIERELADVTKRANDNIDTIMNDHMKLVSQNAQLISDIKQLRACISDALEAYNDADSQGVERRLLRGLEKHLLP